MYIKLGDTAAKVVGISTNDTVSTFAIKGQDGISAVLDNISDEIRLYDDESCTKLTAVYKADKVVRISYEPEKRLVNLTVQVSRVSDIEAEQIKEDLAAQQKTISEQGRKIEEQTEKISEQTATLTEQKNKIESQVSKISALEDELAAAKILLGLEEGERV